MEAVFSPLFAAAKLLVLNPGEFELWKMRIEQYFLMTDYALWEVIVNGDSPPLKRTVDGVEQTYPPTTTEEKLARKNELKGRGTLLMAHLNEHQLKFKGMSHGPFNSRASIGPFTLKGMSRGSKETHSKWEFILKTSQKKYKASDTRNATLAIRVLT
ncbi:hypothetical protein Tco_0202306 [Tanacetum coccineum]